MNLLYEVLQTDEMISEGDSPVECFEWVLGEVLCLDVTIHADVIEDIFQIAFLLWGQVVALDKALIDGECLLAVNAIDDIEFEEPDVMDWTEFTENNENETDS